MSKFKNAFIGLLVLIIFVFSAYSLLLIFGEIGDILIAMFNLFDYKGFPNDTPMAIKGFLYSGFFVIFASCVHYLYISIANLGNDVIHCIKKMF